MTVQEVIDSLNNAWRGLTRKYSEYPHQDTQYALNLLARIIAKIESEMKEREPKEDQISIDEWLSWFKELESRQITRE